MNYIYKVLLQFCLWCKIPLKLLKVYIINVQDCSTLHMIFNESLNNSSFPDELKLADITPIFKKEDATLEKTIDL